MNKEEEFKFKKALKRYLGTKCLLTIAMILAMIALLKLVVVEGTFGAIVLILLIVFIIRGIWRLNLVIR